MKATLLALALLLVGCGETPTGPASTGHWTDHPDRPPQRLRGLPVGTQLPNGDVDWQLVPYPKIVTVVPKATDVLPKDPGQDARTQ